MKKRLLGTLVVSAAVIVVMSAVVFSTPVKADGYGSFVDGEHVISDMIKKNGEKTHPRLIMTNDKIKKLKSHVGDNSTTAKVLAKLKSSADRDLELYKEEPIRYEVSGSKNLLNDSKQVQYRVADLALAYNIFGDEKYAKGAYKELENAAKFQDWNPYHFLDTGEMCTAFALGYDWLYNWMNDDQRAFLRKTMIEKGLNQVMKDYEGKVEHGKRGDRGDGSTRSYEWYKSQKGDNWQFVCIGGTNLAALAIGDESDAKAVSSKVLTYGYKKAYTAVRQGYKSVDGSFIEGLGYWDYATYYLGLISSSLKSTAGTDYGITNHDGVRKSVDFARCMSSNNPTTFSFGDDRPDRDARWSVFLWLGEHFKSRNMADVRLGKLAEEKVGDFTYLDVLWIDESLNSGREQSSPNDYGGKGYANASFRNTWDKSGIVTALHSGVNDYKFHGHYDLGSFYVEYKGTRFITDLGNEDYNLEDRQNAYRIRSEGHNTLVINPSKDVGQSNDVECVITAFQSGNEAYAVTDLTAAYKASGAKKYVRGLKYIKDKNCIIVQDDVTLNSAGEIYWFAHTKGQISVASDGRSAVITVGSDKLWLGILSDGGKFTSMKAVSLPSTPTVSGQTNNSEYRKLAIHLTNVKNTTISVACIPLKSGESKPSWIPSGPTGFGSSMSTPTPTPTKKPTVTPTKAPTATPTKKPTVTPTKAPTATPTKKPTVTPTKAPTATPTKKPTVTPTRRPTVTPTKAPTATPAKTLTATPTNRPTITPLPNLTSAPFVVREPDPTAVPTRVPAEPTSTPTPVATPVPTAEPTKTVVSHVTKYIETIDDDDEVITPYVSPTATVTAEPENTSSATTVTSVPVLTHTIKDEICCNGVSCEINGTSSVSVTSFTGSESDVVIPDSVSVDGVSYKVTEIKDEAFMNNKNIKSLVLGSDLICIGNKAFYGCKNLKKVTGGPKLESIGSKAFGKCSKLTAFKISSPVLKKIGASCFYKDKKLKTLDIRKTDSLTKTGVRSSLKQSSVKTVLVKKSKAKTYKKIFAKTVVGRKVRLKKRV